MAAQLRVNNVGTVLTFTLKNQAGSAHNVTGGAVTIFIQKPEGSRRVLSKTATLVTPSSGIVSYTTIAGDFDIAGVYTFQAKSVVGGTTLYSDLLQQDVAQNLGV